MNPKSEIRNPQSQYLVGPVFSRRIGRSLGVDLLRGQCTFLCPYCEVRVHHVGKLELFDFKAVEPLLAEYRQFCAAHSKNDLDSVTFSGTGEPTLIANLGDILSQFRAVGPFPLTVITNGSLLWMPRVRNNLRAADLVVPSLDAVTESAWRRVNRPHPSLTLKKYLDGTEKFCGEHPGKIWMEVLLVRGINDAPEDIESLGRFLKKLRIDRVQIGTVDRPPARTKAMPVPPALLARISKRVADISGQLVELITRSAPPRLMSRRSPKPGQRVSQRILQSVALRPQTPVELRRLLDIPKELFERNVQALRNEGLLSQVHFGRRVFLKAAPAPPTAHPAT